jgi:N-methylhydantoinase B/oxoprolinase/acetone carboxylase alpha subunit
MRREYTALADCAEGFIFADQMTPEYGAAGRAGGDRGAPAAVAVRDAGSDEWRKIGHDEAGIVLDRGATLALITAGGGGYGSPTEADGPAPTPER